MGVTACQSKKILVVDDDSDLAENLREILCSLGYDADVADSAEAALSKLRESAYSGVITDFRLPGLNGVQLIQHLRRTEVTIPIVMVSGYPDHQMRETAAEAGALAVLSKPIELARLFQLVGSFSQPRAGVWIIDDNTPLAENIAEALHASGVKAWISGSYADATAESTLPRLALVDLRLPDRSGLEVALRLKARDPQIVIWLFTAYTEELCDKAQAELLSSLGLDRTRDVIPKPIEVSRLVERVREMLEAS